MHVQAVHPDPTQAERQEAAAAEGPEPQDEIAPAAPVPNQAQAGAEAQAEAGPGPAQPAPLGRDGRYLELARGLAQGAWIEFRSNRGTKRALRLNWTSQQRGAYLFSNLQGDDTLIVATTRLAERLRDGSARILNGDSLTERAVSQLLTSVTAAPTGVPAG
jgi:hypothetical protein